MVTPTDDLTPLVNLRALRGEVWLSPEELLTAARGARLPWDHVPEQMRTQINDQINLLRPEFRGAASALRNGHECLAPMVSDHHEYDYHEYDQLEEQLQEGRIRPWFWGECLQLLLISRLASHLVDDHLRSPGQTLKRDVMDAVDQGLAFWQTDERSGEEQLALRLLRQAGAREPEFGSALASHTRELQDFLAAQSDISPRAVAWRSLLQARVSDPWRLTCLSPLLPEGHPAYEITISPREYSDPTVHARKLSDFFDAMSVPAPAPRQLCEPDTQGYWTELAHLPVITYPEGRNGDLIRLLAWYLVNLSDGALADLHASKRMDWAYILNDWTDIIPQLRAPWRERLEHAYRLITDQKGSNPNGPALAQES